MPPPDFVDQQQCCPHGAVGLAIDDDEPDPGNGLPGKLGYAALHGHRDGLETDAWQTAVVHPARDRARVEPWGTDLLEGTIRSAAFRQIRPLEIDGARVAVQG